MKKLNLLALVFILIITSCAKKREVDPVHDPDQEVHSKDTLTSSDGTVQELTESGINNAKSDLGKRKLWLYKATVVNTSETPGFAFVGLQNSAKLGYFNFTKDKLQLISAQSIYPKQTENTSRKLLNEWNITHYDTKLNEVNGKVTNKEVEDDEIPHFQKRYFKIDFAKANLTEVYDFPRFQFAMSCFVRGDTFIEDDSLEISNDYMTFVVSAKYVRASQCGSNQVWMDDDWTFTMKIRYSFKRYEPSKTYKPFVYDGGEFDPLHKKYGFFKTYREYLDNNDGRIKIKHFANRWDPNKNHHFFFTKDFPQEYKWIFNDPVKGVMAKTNKTLKEAGIKARFFIHDNDGLDGKTKEFGDIRYSFINFIEEISSGAPLGYGPSDADPLTGEIIAANSMVWTSSLKYYVKRLRDVDANLKEDDNASSIFKKMSRFLGYDSTKWQVPMSFEANKAGDIFHKVMTDNTYGYPFWNSFTTVDPQEHPLFYTRKAESFEHSMDNGQGSHSKL